MSDTPQMCTNYNVRSLEIEMSSDTPSKKDKKFLAIQFSEAEENEFCPINDENIEDVVAEFVPKEFKNILFPDYPKFNKAKILNCGHYFHALSLIYHFFRNTLACPICRHGCTSYPIDLQCISFSSVAMFMHQKTSRLKRQEQTMEAESEHRRLVDSFASTERNNFSMVGDFSVLNFAEDLLQISPTVSIFAYQCNDHIPAFPTYITKASLSLQSLEDHVTIGPNEILPTNRVVNYTLTAGNARRISSKMITHPSGLSLIAYVFVFFIEKKMTRRGVC